MCQHTDPGMTLKHRDLTVWGRVATDASSVAKISNSKQELQNEQKLVKGKVTMRVGSDSKVDKITIAHSLYLRY